MRFRSRVAVPLRRFLTEPLRIALGGPHEVTVTLEDLSPETRADPFLADDVLGLAEGEWNVGVTLITTLDAIAKQRLPAELQGKLFPKIGSGTWVELDGMDVPFEDLPGAYLSTIRAIEQELSGAIHRTVRLFAWRFALNIGPRAVSSGLGSEWSADGTTWYPLVGPGYLYMSSEGLPQLHDRDRAEVQRLVEIDAQEPFAHELLREARSLKRNTRSAYIMAVTALEVGLKRYIAERVPLATWMLEEVQTPPVVRMIQEYLPTLTPEDRKLQPLPERLLKVLRIAVTRRNKLAHVGQEPPTEAELDVAIEAVAETLYVLDWYRGFDWSARHMSLETRKDVGLPE